MYYTAHYTSPVGALTIAANETSITGMDRLPPDRMEDSL